MAGSVFVDTNVLIISAAQDADCKYLLSEDLQDTQMFDKLKVVNPFHTLPESIMS